MNVTGALLEGYVWQSRALLAAEVDGDGAIVVANRALERFAGRPLTGVGIAEIVAPAQRAAFTRWLAGADERWSCATFALQGDAAGPAVDRAVWRRRDRGRLAVVAEPAQQEQERLIEKVLELNDDLVTAHRELVREREHVRRLEAITAAGLAHLRLPDVLDGVLNAIVAALRCERAVILLRDPGHGDLVARAAVGVGPEVRDAIRVPLGRGIAGGIAASARPRVVADLRAEPEVVSDYLRTGARSLAGVPLILEGEVIGVLHVSADAPGRFTEDDLRLLLPAAERAALAIARAELHERERDIAETLQRALLPERLPHCPGVLLTARFEPAGSQVGGDWYDALPLPSGELAVAIGDVAGKGVRAAALMGELRGGLRASALLGGDPAEMLARVDGLAQRAGQMATVALVLVDPRSGDVRHASAGHPPPLHVRADGSAAYLEHGRSTPLLVYAPGVPCGTATLAPGDRLVLATDGLMERRGEAIDTSLERLRVAAEGPAESLDALVDRLLAAVPPPRQGARDDLAVIALERL